MDNFEKQPKAKIDCESGSLETSAERKNDDDKFKPIEVNEDGLSVFDVSLQIISSICGGGIISVPYAMTVAGFHYGLAINVFIILCMMYCTHLYLKSKDIFGFASVSELSYICFGRPSVFIINILVAFVIFGILTLYLILFADISISLVTLVIDNPFTQRKMAYIISVCCFLTPVILRRKLSEIKLQSRILFVGIIMLLGVLTVMQF
jgi:sodium-coupled neutral amino acid transporter 11